MKFSASLSILLIGVGACASAVSLAAQSPSFSNVSVHDPSVIKVGERYYVYGSHGASAWTEDLMHWTQVASSVNNGNPPHFADFANDLDELVAWTNAETLWAADVYQLEDGKFYYYYNVWTNYLNYRSYMGVAVADTVEGPYTDLGEILRAGTGISGFNPAVHPNTIDPTLFREAADDTLWMVYGSYSGGIFLLEMNDQTGFQLPGQSWGTRLIDGGIHEGPFIDYNAATGFYYLFLSYGGLAAGDGYNMRVFRATQPEGPYFDPAGNNMATTELPNQHSRGAIDPYGLKLAGNWQFLPVAGEPEDTSTGYLSPGHNSVIQDPETGKWFNIFHTRFVGRGEAHEVRVHQMWFNEDGWPVMAPHRYAGETQGSYTESEIVGRYKFINHGTDTPGPATPETVEVKTSTVVELLADGSLSGATGNWFMPDDQNIRLTIDGVTYRGVVAEFWDSDQGLWVHGFTAASATNVAVWGSKVAIPDRTLPLNPPDLAPVPHQAMRVGETIEIALVDLQNQSDLLLEFEVLEGPPGLSVGLQSGLVSWTPLVSQGGQVWPVRVRAYDRIETSVADEVAFSIYVGATVELEGLRHDFETAPTGGLTDSAGVATGLTTRLAGTGTGISGNDPNLELDPANGQLLLTTTRTDFNGQVGVGLISAVGHQLSEFGFTGEEDFVVTAQFGPLTHLAHIDQAGVFVGSSATTLTRAGLIYFEANANRLGVHTQNGSDNNPTFLPDMNVADGMSVTIARQDGSWIYLVDGVVSNPIVPNASFLDSLSDLTVGIFASNTLNDVQKTVEVESFSVHVVGDEAVDTAISLWRTQHFGANPADGVAGNDDDPDMDGLSNLLEYAIGTDPMVANAHPFPAPTFSTSGRLSWGFDRIADPAVIYEVVGDATLGLDAAEDDAAYFSAGESNTAGAVSFQDSAPVQADTPRFLQLQVDIVED
ncbi:MAG: glycoside hydrolase family 43 protein [Opitutales bacterium]